MTSTPHARKAERELYGTLTAALLLSALLAAGLVWPRREGLPAPSSKEKNFALDEPVMPR